MSLNPTSIIKESLAVQGDAFIALVEKAAAILRGESGRIGRQTVEDRLVRLDASGEAIVVGDLHGDLQSLTTILKSCGFMEKVTEGKDVVLVFLGDYGDRGAHSAEVYYVVLTLKRLFPANVVLLRGNHEGPEDLLASPHDLPMQFKHRFGTDGAEAYAKTRELFAYLYNAVLVEERCVMVHGGLPADLSNSQDLARAHLVHPEKRLLEDLLWSDPSEAVQDVAFSPRGAGQLFGKKITTQVLEKLNVKVLIRGHEPCEEGVRINHDGRVLTLFSMKGAPYFNECGAYLDLPLSEKIENAQQLLPWTHKF
ncbi:serine/threonine protein phosphatase [Candidatus Bathyarchaeota archaeon A05DMB-2]|nr:serine/threonine protein phosphatase [Candidatus Bathyarchaeota archaeon A05DMB-2]